MATTTHWTLVRPRPGISGCLLGMRVRYDGGHKEDTYVTGTLGRHVEFVPYCPESAIGLGTPRTPIRLVARGDAVHAINTRSANIDNTEALRAFGVSVKPEVADFSGFIVKRNSPSCGLHSVPVFADSGGTEGPPVAAASGIFTQALLATNPELPIEDEERLKNPDRRRNFVTRIFALARWRALISVGMTTARLADFHHRHRFLLLAHDETTYCNLEAVVSSALDSIIETTARTLPSAVHGRTQPAHDAEIKRAHAAADTGIG
jgi:uncharacterized protein YbbK (DUF523 family)